MNPESYIDSVESFIRRGQGRIHMMGIGGVGMAGVAYLLKQRGFTVDGCDRICGPLCQWLAKNGIAVLKGHNQSHAEKGCDLVVYTPAIDPDDIELNAFRKSNVPAVCRGKVLPLLLGAFTSVAVAGTHGKTTTATFIAHLLKQCGLSAGWCIGGNSASLGGVAELPEACDALVVEADESDGTLSGYVVDIAVITNVEFDHMEHFDSEEDFKVCFRKFAGNARRHVIYCADSELASEICSELPKALSFGFSETADLKLSDLKLSAERSEFLVSGLGVNAERITIPCPGKHNVMNAAAGILAVLQFGADIEVLKGAVSHVALPERRNQKVIDGEITVINDYAHHPTAIRALIQTPRAEGKGRLRAVFQPHRYTRTKALAQDFVHAFKGVDELLLLPVYAASEQPLAGGYTHDLYVNMRNQGTVKRLLYSRTVSGAWEYFSKTLEPGDTLLVIGAGDVEQIGHWLRRDFRDGRHNRITEIYSELDHFCGNGMLELDYPAGAGTMLGSGGEADAFIRISSADQLAGVSAYCRTKGVNLHLMGAGGNVIVSDTGIRGVTVRLCGGEFGEIQVDGQVIRAGAGVTVGRLLDCAEAEGLSGLEFLEGMPGVVGGIVAMNAGAYGEDAGSVLDRIVCQDDEGRERVINGGAVTCSYRSMDCLKGRVVLSADFRCVKKSSQAIAAKRQKLLEKRSWMRGRRSVGSVFRNPPGLYAGKLIEDCGFKNFRVGGVTVSSEHANFFVNDGNGTSSDMIALIDLVAAEVRIRKGTVLEREVKILE